jgi:hypothetical protein
MRLGDYTRTTHSLVEHESCSRKRGRNADVYLIWILYGVIKVYTDEDLKWDWGFHSIHLSVTVALKSHYKNSRVYI